MNDRSVPMVSCFSCGQSYPVFGTPHICACGGQYDYSRFPLYEPPEELCRDGMWRYRSSLGLPAEAPMVNLGEGDTPLLPGEFNGINVFYKMESMNPSGSYKDRGSAILVSFLKSRGVTSVVEDSSGNAGASLAAYCARAGVEARIFVPESASGPKRWQIEMYGAQVEGIPGPRLKAGEAVLLAVENGEVYASHAYMPFGLTGIATIAYEIFETLGRAPGTVIAPVGHGGLLYGIMLGFEALQDAGVSNSLPYYIGVQAEVCAPLVRAFESRSQVIPEITAGFTVAEGTSVVHPMRGGQILRRLYSKGGRMVSVNESALIKAYKRTASKGIYVEPTACLPQAALLNDKIEVIEPVVAILTGSGLKTNII
jgi:threonine synthase